MGKTIIKILDVLYRILRVCLHYICAVIYGFRGKKVPPLKNPILNLSATELAKRIREGTGHTKDFKYYIVSLAVTAGNAFSIMIYAFMFHYVYVYYMLSSASVVQAYIDRINEVEPYINATVDRRFKDALEEAKKADALVASGKMTREQLRNEKPLLGVPFTVKILITVKGFRCTAGSLLFKDLRAQEDGVSVALMKKAGAIVLASTNSPECGLSFQSSNNIHGTTLNPYDTSRTSGGSSGGESALIGAAGSVIGLGNDLCGSVRIPNLFTGIFGHKPSRGIVSNEGSFPVPDPDLRRMLNTGPMCRYAEDLVTSMRILSAPDEICSKFGQRVNFEKLKVYYLYSFGKNLPFIENVDPEIKDAIRKVVSHFQKKGSKIEEVSLPLLKHSSSMFFNALLSSIPDVEKTMTAGRAKLNPLQELIKFLCFRSMFTVGFVLALHAKNTFLYDESMVDFYEKIKITLADQLNTLLDENSVLIMPTLPFPAPYHNEIHMLTASVGYTAIFNVLGLPATQCPVGMNKQGLPLGLQIAGRRGNDPLTVSCALEVEKAFGGWKAP